MTPGIARPYRRDGASGAARQPEGAATSIATSGPSDGRTERNAEIPLARDLAGRTVLVYRDPERVPTSLAERNDR